MKVTFSFLLLVFLAGCVGGGDSSGGGKSKKVVAKPASASTVTGSGNANYYSNLNLGKLDIERQYLRLSNDLATDSKEKGVYIFYTNTKADAPRLKLNGLCTRDFTNLRAETTIPMPPNLKPSFNKRDCEADGTWILDEIELKGIDDGEYILNIIGLHRKTNETYLIKIKVIKDTQAPLLTPQDRTALKLQSGVYRRNINRVVGEKVVFKSSGDISDVKVTSTNSFGIIVFPFTAQLSKPSSSESTITLDSSGILDAGEYTIAVEAIDYANNKSTFTYNLNYQNVIPKFSINEDVNESSIVLYSSNEQQSFLGNCQAIDTINIFLTNRDKSAFNLTDSSISNTCQNVSGAWSAGPYKLTAGDNLFAFYARDIFGNQKILNVKVVKVATPPHLDFLLQHPSDLKEGAILLRNKSPEYISGTCGTGLRFILTNLQSGETLQSACVSRQWRIDISLNTSNGETPQNFLLKIIDAENKIREIPFAAVYDNTAPSGAISDVYLFQETSYNGGKKTYRTHSNVNLLSGNCSPDVAIIDVLPADRKVYLQADNQCASSGVFYLVSSNTLPNGFTDYQLNFTDKANNLRENAANFSIDYRSPVPSGNFTSPNISGINFTTYLTELPFYGSCSKTVKQMRLIMQTATPQERTVDCNNVSDNWNMGNWTLPEGNTFFTLQTISLWGTTQSRSFNIESKPLKLTGPIEIELNEGQVIPPTFIYVPANLSLGSTPDGQSYIKDEHFPSWINFTTTLTSEKLILKLTGQVPEVVSESEKNISSAKITFNNGAQSAELTGIKIRVIANPIPTFSITTPSELKVDSSISSDEDVARTFTLQTAEVNLQGECSQHINSFIIKKITTAATTQTAITCSVPAGALKGSWSSKLTLEPMPQNYELIAQSSSGTTTLQRKIKLTISRAVPHFNDSATGTRTLELKDGTFFEYTPDVTNPVGATPITLSVSNKPSWLQFNSSDGRLFGVIPIGTSSPSNDIVLTLTQSSGADPYHEDLRLHLNIVGDPLAINAWHINNRGQRNFSSATLPTSKANVVGADIHILNSISSSAWTDNKGEDNIGTGIKVGVSDDSFNLDHPDLSANFNSECHKNLFSSDIKNLTNPSYPIGSHGTSVSGLIGALGWNNLGTRGVAPGVTLCGIKFLTQGSEEHLIYVMGDTAAEVEQASQYTDGDGEKQSYDVFNQSWGWGLSIPVSYSIIGIDYINILQEQLTEGRQNKGTLFVRSAGNSYDDLINANMDYHNSHYGMIVVAATNATGKKSSYSTPGSCLWISAPGGEYGDDNPAMMTTDTAGCDRGYSRSDLSHPINSFEKSESQNVNCNYTSRFNGTSSASPVVAGVVALILQANPDLNWREVKYILAKTASTQFDTNPDPRTYAQENLSSLMLTRAKGTRTGLHAQTGWTVNEANFFFHDFYGFGMVDAARAVQAAQNWKYDTSNAHWKGHSLLNYPSDSGIAADGLSLTINDSGDILNKEVTIAAPSKSFFIEAVTVVVNISHNSPGDVGIELWSPLRHPPQGGHERTGTILLNGNNAFYKSGDSCDDGDDDTEDVCPKNLVNVTLLTNTFYGEDVRADTTHTNSDTLGSQLKWYLRFVDLNQNGIGGTLNSYKIIFHGHYKE